MGQIFTERASRTDCALDKSMVIPTLSESILRSANASNPIQKLSFNALAAKTFTTLRAGFALTVIVLPKATRLPALVAFLCFNTTRQRPGSKILPLLFTALVTTDSKASMMLLTSFLATPLAASSAPKVSLLVITFPEPFIAFMDFIAFTMTAADVVWEIHTK